MAIAVTSILLVSMGAALTMTIGATDAGDDGSRKGAQAAETLTQVNAELSTATTIGALSGTGIRFTVPDRDGDGQPENIEYTYSGTPGAPLRRSYNLAGAQPVLADVQTLSVAVATRPPAVPVESAERILQSCDTPSGSTQSTFLVGKDEFCAQYVRPLLPAGTVSWKITKVRVFLLRDNASTILLRISIRTADSALKPTSTILASVTLNSGALSTTMTASLYAIGPVNNLSPGQGVCIVIDGALDNAKAVAGFVEGGSGQPYNSHYISTSNAGAAWTAPSDAADLRFELIGTSTTMVEP